MKLFKFLPFALAITAMVGCSDDSFVETPGDSGILEDGGYVSVNLNLPTINTKTRADFNDGLSSEYSVKNGAIILFDANQNIVVKPVYTAAELGFTMNENTNVTSSSAKVVIPNKAVTPTHILVLLNMTDEMGVRIGRDDITDYSSLIAVLNETSAITNGSHFMSNSTFDNSNAPASVYTGTNASIKGIQSLQLIDPLSISASKDANVVTSTNVYVERASVKVDLTFGLSGQDGIGGTVDIATNLPTIEFPNGDVLKVLGWTLTVTNNSFYPVKNIDQTTWNDWTNAKKYFMADNVCDAKNYRSYWAIDPDYKGGLTLVAGTHGYFTNFTYATFGDAVGNKAGIDYPQYCVENTFTAANQNQNQTTSVLIAAQYKVNNGTTGEHIYSFSGSIFNGATFKAELAEKLNMLGYRNGEATLVAGDFVLVEKPNHIYKDFVKYAGSNNLVLGGNTILEKSADEAANFVAMNAILQAFGTRTVAVYVNGNCFYSIPIRHFNDTEVEVSNADNPVTPEGYEGTDGPGVNKTHQEGRYGVVRNNWYSVNVNSIKQIGRPTPPDPELPINPDPGFPDPTEPIPGEPTPDDVETLYIQAQINVLPWAKRSQNADL